MRIGFDAKRAFCNSTGLGVYSRSTLDILSRFHPDHEYFAYTPRCGKDLFPLSRSRSNLVAVRPSGVWAGPLQSLWRAAGMTRRFSSDGLDLFHGLSHELPLGLEQTGIKSVVTIHDMLPFRFPELFPAVDRIIYRRKFRRACERADRIIAVSAQTRDDIIHYFGTDEARITVVHQGCDPAFYERASEDEVKRVRAAYNLPEEYVLYVGAVIERKNLLVLVRAVEELNRQGRKVVLLGAGKGGAYFNKVRDYVTEKGLEVSVRLPGPVPFADLPALYAGASVFVYPSKYEGFGIPIIEALFSGTPVITSKGSCFSEPGGPHSLYTEPGDVEELAEALRSVLDDPDKARSMVEAGYAHAARFHEKEVADNLMHLYMDVLG